MGRPRCSEDQGNAKSSKSKKASVNGVKSPGKIKKATAKSKKLSLSAGVLQSRGQSQSCHQCRQSIHSSKGVSEVKKGKERLKCSKCTKFWCEQCLMNRYGVIKDDADPTTWLCPVCEKKCNCSLCRKKEGKLATGILTPLVKNSGFDSVSEFLDKGTNDIAKVLQWQSPDTTCVTSSVTKSPGKGSPPSTSESPPKAKGRKRERNNHENSKSLANGTHSKSSSPTDSETNSCHGRRKNGISHSNSDCSGSNDVSSHGKTRPKRRKVAHSRYSITIEDDPDTLPNHNSLSDQQGDVIHQTDSSPASLLSPPSHPKVLDSSLLTPGREAERCADNVMKEAPLLGSPSSDTPRRRSLRQRKQVVNTLKQSPESPSERRTSDKERNVQFKSPISSFKSPEERIRSSKCAQQTKSQDFIAKEHALDLLRSEEMNALRQKKSDYEQKIQEEKAKRKEETLLIRKSAKEERERERAAKSEERKKAIEEKIRIKEELQLSKIRAQERMKLAQSVKKQAMKDLKKRQRENEKIRKQELLLELKEKNKEERRRKLELVCTPILCGKEELCLEDDSPNLCQESDIPSLPSLPPLTFPKGTVPPLLMSNFLFVSEFLYTFCEPLGLKRRMSGSELCRAMTGGRGMADVYLSLLKTLVDDDSHLKKDLKPPKRQRDLEQIAKVYLRENNINGFAICTSPSDGPTFEESVILLDHLCHEALSTPTITEHLESFKDCINQIKREQRVREKEVTKRIGDSLKQLCDEGGSLEEITKKRSELCREITDVRESFENEVCQAGGSTRNNFLGTDRYDRKYWRLQSVPGLVVERNSFECPSLSDDSNLPQWAVVDTHSLLEELLSGLHPNGCREKPLYDSLLPLKIFETTCTKSTIK